MRRITVLTSLVAVVALTLVVAACGSSEGPGWTFAPPTEAPASEPAASGDASAAPSAGASEAPASNAPSAGASGGTGEVVQVSALNVTWETPAISAPAGAAFTIHFNNKDASVQHNIEIKDAAGMTMFKGEIITGPAEVDYQVPALAAGTYQFICTVHPAMVGTLTVGG
jgi:plastocyanin